MKQEKYTEQQILKKMPNKTMDILIHDSTDTLTERCI
jgi:hypothetical protein